MESFYTENILSLENVIRTEIGSGNNIISSWLIKPIPGFLIKNFYQI